MGDTLNGGSDFRKSDLSYSYAEFQKLSIEDKEDILDSWMSKNKAFIEEKKREGAVWILLWGGEVDEDSIVCYSNSDIPSNSEIFELAQKNNKAPFIVNGSFGIDDLGIDFQRFSDVPADTHRMDLGEAWDFLQNKDKLFQENPEEYHRRFMDLIAD